MTDQSAYNKSTKNNKLILVGVITKAHGIMGQVVVRSYTEPPGNIVNLPIFDKDKNSTVLKLIRVQPNGTLICSIKDCRDRTSAEMLIKKQLYCLRQDLPDDLEEDEFYIEDLVGLKVLDTEGEHIGTVLNVANYGGGDIIDVKLMDKKDSELLPFTKEYFPEIGEDFVVLDRHCKEP